MPEMKTIACALVLALAGVTLAACAATTSSQPMPVARTTEQIRGDCWMKYEGDTKMNIDKRAALVDACIAERGKSGAPIN
jgi:Spy/CpxP family protein refolding chaperone